MKLMKRLLASIFFGACTLIFAGNALAQNCPNADGTSTNPGTWPTGSYSRVCGTATHAADLVTAAQPNNAWKDADARLKGWIAINGDEIQLTINSLSIANPAHSITVTYEIQVNESLFTVATGLRDAINANALLQSAGLTASQNGTSVYFYDPTGKITSWSVNIDPALGQPGPNETVTLSQAAGFYTADITGPSSGGLVFYNFTDAAAYNAATDPANHLAASAQSTGISEVGTGANFVGTHSAIFDNYTDLGVSKPNSNFQHTVRHETGHHVDRIYRRDALVSGIGNLASQSAQVVNQWNVDWAIFTDPRSEPCVYQVSFPPQNITYEAGPFAFKKDSSGNYFCNGANGGGMSLQGDYAGMSNLNAAKKAFPQIFDKGTAAEIRAEYFAEYYALGEEAGVPPYTPTASGDFVGNLYAFQCTQTLLNSMLASGQVDPMPNVIRSAPFYNGANHPLYYSCVPN